MSEPFDWKNGLVAIIGNRPDQEGTGPIGVGYIVSPDGLIATCAHVIDQSTWNRDWNTPLQVRFQATSRYAEALVLEEYYKKDDLDLAILQLQTDLPETAVALPLCSSAGTTGHTTHMWGFPDGYEKGLLGEGRVVGIEGRDQLQLTSTQTTRGYSGGPVWDDKWQRVIGMITSGSKPDTLGRLQYENFALPSETITAACPLLSLTPQADPHQATGLKTPIPPQPTYGQLFGRQPFLDQAVSLLEQHGRLALFGQAGAGKTAAAQALAHDSRLAGAAPHGRPWVTLGPEPDRFTVLGDLLESQFGLGIDQLIDVPAREQELRHVLDNRSCLLILDDIWRKDDARPFLDACGPSVRVLLTTRNEQLADDLHLATFKVPVLQTDPALDMLANAGQKARAAVESNPASAALLATRVGHLPLALHVSGRRLNRLARAVLPQEAAERLVNELTEERYRLLALRAAEDRPGLAEAEPSLLEILALSYDRLPDDAVRTVFCRLAVFGPQPASFDLQAIIAVSDMSPGLADDALLDLIDAGLLERLPG